MWKSIALFIFIGALCYLAEGATIDDLHRAIDESGADFRQASTDRIKAAVSQAESGSNRWQQRRCINEIKGRAFSVVNRSIGRSFGDYHSEAKFNPPSDLQTLTKEQLKNNYKKRFQDSLESTIKEFENDIRGC